MTDHELFYNHHRFTVMIHWERQLTSCVSTTFKYSACVSSEHKYRNNVLILCVYVFSDLFPVHHDSMRAVTVNDHVYHVSGLTR